MERKKDLARVNALYTEYVFIAFNSFLEYYELNNDISEDNHDLEIESKIKRDFFATIVFSGLAVEGFIYDYSAVVLSDKYTNDHLDRLPLFDKYIVIPQLITGNKVNKAEKWISPLKELIKSRNNLIHSKSVPFRYERLTDPTYLDEISLVKNSITLKNCIDVLIQIDNFFRKISVKNISTPNLIFDRTTFVKDFNRAKKKYHLR